MDTGTGLEFLLAMVEPDRAEQARRRIGRPPAKPERLSPKQLVTRLTDPGRPSSALMWVLEQEDKETSKAVYQHGGISEGLRTDIAHGLPFAPLPPATRPAWEMSDTPQTLDPPLPSQTAVQALRRSWTMAWARSAATRISRDDWPWVAVEDSVEPLPGYARWALSTRIDCPPGLRAQFGSHPKFRHRVRTAGIVSGPREYVEQWRPARSVLEVLEIGRSAFPDRAEQAAEVLRPLVGRELADRPEAWAVLAQLLPSFTGTLPELVATSGAVAHTA